MSTIGIIGGTGFVGTHLVAQLAEKGHKVLIFTRKGGTKRDASTNVSYHVFDYKTKQCDAEAFARLDAVVNLAGAAVAEKRLTTARKQEIVSSRVDNTQWLLQQIEAHAKNCKTFVAASATGFYGPDRPGTTPFTETAPPYNDFLGETCRKWEAASLAGSGIVRTVILRIGIVMGKEGGAFPELAGPLKFGVMPVLGSGRQLVSWIEVEDLARLIGFALETQSVSGIYNAVTPNPVTHRDLMKAIAAQKGGLAIPVPVPAFALKIALGELSTEVLKSCTVSAKKTADTGFRFLHPTIGEALAHIMKKSG